MVRVMVVLLTGGALALAISGAASGAAAAPNFAGGGPWYNTDGQPLTISGLRGKVVAVDMWTAGCINCLDILPYVKQWYAKYRDRGLVVVGVHTPEFENEHALKYVQDAIARLGIVFPVVVDNDYRIWHAYNNEYWPTVYLIDKHGRLRYSHIGEGDYGATEQMIQRLLAEPR